MKDLRGLKVVSGRTYYRWRRDGRSFYQRLPEPDHPNFSAAYKAAVTAAQPGPAVQVPAGDLAAQKVRLWNAASEAKGRGDRKLPAWAVALAREARKRVARKGIEYSLTREELSLLVRRAGGCCEVSGMSFRFERQSGSLYRPFAPSLDRLNPSEGYHFRNLRLTCVIVNAALNQWGEAPFWEMVEAASRRLGGTDIQERRYNGPEPDLPAEKGE